MLNCSQEHKRLMSLTSLSAVILPFTDKSVSDLLMDDVCQMLFIFEPCHRLRPSNFVLVMFIQFWLESQLISCNWYLRMDVEQVKCTFQKVKIWLNTWLTAFSHTRPPRTLAFCKYSRWWFDHVELTNTRYIRFQIFEILYLYIVFVQLMCYIQHILSSVFHKNDVLLEQFVFALFFLNCIIQRICLSP